MLDKNKCKKIIDIGLGYGASFVEIFEERKFRTNIRFIDGGADSINSGKTYGIGIRLYNGLNSVYATTNNSEIESLIKTVTNLAKSINKECTVKAVTLKDINYDNINNITKYPKDYSIAYKKAIMKRASDAATSYDDIISKATVNYIDEDQQVLIANSDGKYVTDRRVRTRLAVIAIAEKDGKMESGHNAPGASMGLEFYDKIDVEGVGVEAARIAKKMFYANECPSGVMDVVINNGFGGVIFHEACGHSLEATAVSKNQSVFSNKLGENIASNLVTAIDDGTIPNAWGSSNIDDEGNKTQKNILIKNGKLEKYLVDQFNGLRMKTITSGSGRRQSYDFEPTSRMTNTYIDNGESTFDEIIENTNLGLFAATLGGGSVNPSTGEFNFSVIEGYMIRDGKIAEPVKGASLVGDGASILKNIDMVGNNLRREQGMCGSSSGSIPVDVGQPTIRVKNISVGGRGGALK